MVLLFLSCSSNSMPRIIQCLQCVRTWSNMWGTLPLSLKSNQSTWWNDWHIIASVATGVDTGSRRVKAKDARDRVSEAPCAVLLGDWCHTLLVSALLLLGDQCLDLLPFCYFRNTEWKHTSSIITNEESNMNVFMEFHKAGLCLYSWIIIMLVKGRCLICCCDSDPECNKSLLDFNISYCRRYLLCGCLSRVFCPRISPAREVEEKEPAIQSQQEATGHCSSPLLNSSLWHPGGGGLHIFKKQH